jgi:hypothetical protein
MPARGSRRRLAFVDHTRPKVALTQDGTVPDEPREFAGTDALLSWLERLTLEYAPDVRWSAPRRGVSLRGPAAVLAYLREECRSMEAPRVCVLRDAKGPSQRFHEFTIRFRLLPPGIDGVGHPAGADVELERLRVCTYDESCRIVVETCIETWTWLPVGAMGGSAGG